LHAVAAATSSAGTAGRLRGMRASLDGGGRLLLLLLLLLTCAHMC